MDTTPTQAPVPQIVQCQCPHRRRWWSPIGSFFRFLGLIVLLAVVFVVGVLVGGSGPVALPFEQATGASGTEGIVPHGNVMFRAGVGTFKIGLGGDDRQFGVITAISGQKVTIADNGGGTQSVIITADTSVYDGETEIAMWKLRVGNPIRVFGDDEDGVITAKLIEIIR